MGATKRKVNYTIVMTATFTVSCTQSKNLANTQEEIINAYHERASMRGIQRIYGTAPATLSNWLKSPDTDNPTPTTCKT